MYPSSLALSPPSFPAISQMSFIKKNKGKRPHKYLKERERESLSSLSLGLCLSFTDISWKFQNSPSCSALIAFSGTFLLLHKCPCGEIQLIIAAVCSQSLEECQQSSWMGRERYSVQTSKPTIAVFFSRAKGGQGRLISGTVFCWSVIP